MNINLKLKIMERFGNQADFALHIRENESVISKVIRGRREISQDKKEAWAKALGCKAEEIFQG